MAEQPLTSDQVHLEIPVRETEHWSSEEIVRWAWQTFGSDLKVLTSFAAEGVVILDLFHNEGIRPRVCTLDTGRLPNETYEVIEAVRLRYQLDLEILFPDSERVEAMTRQQGLNLFYNSVEARRQCCRVRKVEPMERALRKARAWVTGLLREQSRHRAATPKVSFDESGRCKIAPIADWTHEQVWAYIRANQLPYNKLYDQGYSSIGCAPCTRPVNVGQELRSGRWWWEDERKKECGLHG